MSHKIQTLNFDLMGIKTASDHIRIMNMTSVSISLIFYYMQCIKYDLSL